MIERKWENTTNKNIRLYSEYLEKIKDESHCQRFDDWDSFCNWAKEKFSYSSELKIGHLIYVRKYDDNGIWDEENTYIDGLRYPIENYYPLYIKWKEQIMAEPHDESFGSWDNFCECCIDLGFFSKDKEIVCKKKKNEPWSKENIIFKKTEWIFTKLQFPELYSIWQYINDVCYNEKHEQYRYYGGKGIKVQEDWVKSFDDFCSWAIGATLYDRAVSGREVYTIVRDDKLGDFCEENCDIVPKAYLYTKRIDTDVKAKMRKRLLIQQKMWDNTVVRKKNKLIKNERIRYDTKKVDMKWNRSAKEQKEYTKYKKKLRYYRNKKDAPIHLQYHDFIGIDMKSEEDKEFRMANKKNGLDFVCPLCWNRIADCECDYSPYALVQIDKNIQYAVRELNKKGYHTVGCCEGHWFNSSTTMIYIELEEAGYFPYLVKRLGFPSDGWNCNNTTLYYTLKKRWNRPETEAKKAIAIEELNKWIDSIPTSAKLEEMYAEENS